MVSKCNPHRPSARGKVTLKRSSPLHHDVARSPVIFAIVAIMID